jgi:hypothetical protein
VKQRDDVHEQYSQWLAQIFNDTAPSGPSTPANHALRHASTGVGVSAVRAVHSTQQKANELLLLWLEHDKNGESAKTGWRMRNSLCSKVLGIKTGLEAVGPVKKMDATRDWLMFRYGTIHRTG